jgi:hypothetical protein
MTKEDEHAKKVESYIAENIYSKQKKRLSMVLKEKNTTANKRTYNMNPIAQRQK